MQIKEVYGPNAVLIKVNFSWEHTSNVIMEIKRKFVALLNLVLQILKVSNC